MSWSEGRQHQAAASRKGLRLTYEPLNGSCSHTCVEDDLKLRLAYLYEAKVFRRRGPASCFHLESWLGSNGRTLCRLFLSRGFCLWMPSFCGSMFDLGVD